MNAEIVTPCPEEVEVAKHNANGWVYRIAGQFNANGPVPPEAIIGAWKVDAQGKIVGSFVKNTRYDPTRWPA